LLASHPIGKGEEGNAARSPPALVPRIHAADELETGMDVLVVSAADASASTAEAKRKIWRRRNSHQAGG